MYGLRPPSDSLNIQQKGKYMKAKKQQKVEYVRLKVTRPHLNQTSGGYFSASSKEYTKTMTFAKHNLAFQIMILRNAGYKVDPVS